MTVATSDFWLSAGASPSSDRDCPQSSGSAPSAPQAGQAVFMPSSVQGAGHRTGVAGFLWGTLSQRIVRCEHSDREHGQQQGKTQEERADTLWDWFGVHLCVYPLGNMVFGGVYDPPERFQGATYLVPQANLLRESHIAPFSIYNPFHPLTICLVETFAFEGL